MPICKSLLKLRLENTKVKGDGASVVLECCPNIYSLGYLVFAAAGLKQVFGYEDLHETVRLLIFVVTIDQVETDNENLRQAEMFK